MMSLALGRLTSGQAPRDVVDIEIANDRRHAEELIPRLQDLLAEAGHSMADLDLLVVDVGPGRFTGLRVGLATVRALAFGLDRPVVAVSSLEALAAGAPEPTGTVTASIDARRQEVFQQVFTNGVPDGPAMVGRPEEIASAARGVVVGDGLDRYVDAYKDVASALNPDILELSLGRNPRAADLLVCAVDRVAVPGNEIVPVYLREPDAVANIRTRSEGSK